MSSPLARLAPKTLLPNGEGFGGTPLLEQCDVAYALAGLPQGVTCLLRAMYARDHGQSNMRDLYVWGWMESAALAEQHGWKPPKGKELLKTLAARAIDELVYPQLLKCPHCSGAGAVQPNQHNPNGDCRLCANTGNRAPSDDEMAWMFGMTLADWRNIWAPRYVRIMGRMLEWHSQGTAHVRRRLGRQE